MLIWFRRQFCKNSLAQLEVLLAPGPSTGIRQAQKCTWRCSWSCRQDISNFVQASFHIESGYESRQSLRHISQIPQCTCPISHNAPFRTQTWAFLFWMVHCGIWERCTVGFVNLVNWYNSPVAYSITADKNFSRRCSTNICQRWPEILLLGLTTRVRLLASPPEGREICWIKFVRSVPCCPVTKEG